MNCVWTRWIPGTQSRTAAGRMAVTCQECSGTMPAGLGEQSGEGRG